MKQFLTVYLEKYLETSAIAGAELSGLSWKIVTQIAIRSVAFKRESACATAGVGWAQGTPDVVDMAAK
jgi:hypothetical protein